MILINEDTMKKRFIFIPLIVISYLAHLYLYYFVFDEIRPLISFFLTVPFYVIMYVYYQETRLIVTFSFISIFTYMAYWFFLGFLKEFAFNAPNMRLIGIVSFFGSLINMVIGFAIVLNANRNKFIALSFLLFAVVNFIFASYYNFFFENLIRSIFGPDITDVNNALGAMEGLYVFLQILIVGMQAVIIYKLDINQEYKILTFKHQNK
jgi:hypothetical protein